MKANDLTLRTLILVLAYIHRHNISWLPGRGMGATHLQMLTRWLGHPAPRLRTLRKHRLLAAHLALLQASGLVKAVHEGDEKHPHWRCQPAVFDWLRADKRIQYGRFLDVLPDSAVWHSTLQALNLTESIPIDLAVYLNQSLQRQSETADLAPQSRANWVLADSPNHWKIELPDDLPLPILFHLLQFGDWQPNQPWVCSPMTIVQAGKRGYSPLVMQRYVAQSTGQPLTADQQHQLLTWWDQTTQVQIRNVTLLSTSKPDQLAEIVRNRRLYPRLHQQISPRHAIVSAEIIPSLTRWLADRNIPLDVPASSPYSTSESAPEYTWLALRVLAGISSLIQLPVSIPYAEMETAENRLTEEERTELDFLAQEILERLNQAVRGRDGFFPASHSVNEIWLTTIRIAIHEERCLDIAYQSLVDKTPTHRQVQPLRLEQQGDLYYLHAYCYLAEANRIFRLDRLHACQMADCE